MDSISNSGAAFANSQNISVDVKPNIASNSETATQARQVTQAETNQVNAAEKSNQVKLNTADTETREVSPELEQAVTELESYVNKSNLTLAFSVDEKTDKSVAMLKDKDSGDVIRQIPSQELLDIAAQVKQITSENGSAVGLLVNGKF